MIYTPENAITRKGRLTMLQVVIIHLNLKSFSNGMGSVIRDSVLDITSAFNLASLGVTPKHVQFLFCLKGTSVMFQTSTFLNIGEL